VTGLEVIEPGLATTVQDLGRPGFGAYGVPEGGGMDRGLLATANRLAGNPESAAALEFVITGPELRWTGRRRLRCIVAGDSISEATLAQGDRLAVAPLRGRAYGYVAVNGGLDVPEVMGARGTCLPGGFGGFLGRELRRGDLLPVGPGTAVRSPAAGGDDGARMSVVGDSVEGTAGGPGATDHPPAPPRSGLSSPPGGWPATATASASA
jgi:allophanate hydrolase subunit 2